MQIYIVNQITSQCQFIQTYFKGSSSTRDPHNIIWSAPISPFVKLNIDGSSLGNPGSLGFGGIVRDSRGFWFSGFYGHFDHTTNIHVELLAILNGMRHAWNNGFRHIIIETDSLVAIHLIE
ncbi:hypothetical protein D0Y65_045822 [Glycine soja]|uniref:RNase H type-1 domain-containing protein n=1 Tax=Glycine soja TaxID=3848 RepID=A0A445G6Q3_GLYSO|nr:hypothetical protein D0Y65_045822 [Glycine soja]